MRMQVKINNSWKYVFCRNALIDVPITTNDKTKAVNWHSNSIAYFTRMFGNLDFRGI